MKITILGSGTSTGVPMIGCNCDVCTSSNLKNVRLRSSCLITTNDNKNILIDVTPDFRQQALINNINRIDSIFLTHAHADHVLGVDDLRALNFAQKNTIPCYATKETLEDLVTFLPYLKTLNPNYEGGPAPKLEFKYITNNECIIVNDELIKPFKLMHGKLETTGYRIKNFAYATDCNNIPEETFELLRDLDILIIDGLRFSDHKTHFTIPQSIEIAKRIDAKKTYLTHMSHDVNYVTVSKELPERIYLAYDGLSFDL